MLLAGAAIWPGVDSTLAPWRSLLIQILQLDSFLATYHSYVEKSMKALLCEPWGVTSSKSLAVQGRYFVVMVHSTPIMEFLSWRASLRHAGHSAWCTDLAAGILLGKHGGWFEVPETVVARSMHCPHCMWGILTDACKSVVPSRWQALLCHLGYCHAPLGAQTATRNLWLGNGALKCLQGESTIQCKCSYRQLECCHIPRGHRYLYLWFSYLMCSILLMK